MLSLEAGEPEPLEVIPSDYSAEDHPRRTTLRNLPARQPRYFAHQLHSYSLNTYLIVMTGELKKKKEENKRVI